MAASVASGRSPGTIPYPPSVSRGTPPRLRCNLPRLRHHREDGSLLLDLCLSLASSDQPHRLLHPRGDLVAHIGVLGQEGLGVLPDFTMIPRSAAVSSSDPSFEMPWPYWMSNSACRKGALTLDFTTLTRTRE